MALSNIILSVILIKVLTSTVAEFLDPCQCYMLGTVESIDGESICHQSSLKCKCLRNVIGLNCDKCKTGYYGILSGKGCKKCNCDPDGSVDQICNENTGHCRCKEGFTGYNCNTCKLGYFRKSKEICQHCDCNIFGSKTTQCGQNGNCICLPNATGKHCDSCKELTQNIKHGCLECPECYNIIQKEVEKLSVNIDKLTDIVSNALKNSKNIKIVSHLEEFLNKLIELLKNIKKLKENVKKTNETINMDLISKLSRKLTEINNKIGILKQKLQPNDISKLQKNLNSNLKEITNLLEIWNGAIKKAEEANTNVQQSNEGLLKLKNNAVKVSSSMTNTLKEIEEETEISEAICKDANNLSVQIFNRNIALNNEVTNLKEQLSTLTTNKVHYESKQMFEASLHTKSTATEIFEKTKELPSGLALPLHNFEKRLNDIRDKLNEFKIKDDNANKILDEIVQKLEACKTRRDDCESYLDDLKKVNDNIDRIIKTISDLVVEKQNLLMDFRKGLNNSTIEVKNKLREAQLIRKNIKNLQTSLTAEENKLKANVTTNLENLEEVNKSTKHSITKNEEDIKNLKEELSKQKQILIEVLQKIKNNSKEIEDVKDEVKRKIEQNKSHYKDLEYQEEILINIMKLLNVEPTDDIKKETKKITEIINFIEALPLSEKQLTNIERQIKKAEKNLRSSEQQTEEANNFKDLQKEYRKLKAEVNNMEIVAESLRNNKIFGCVRPMETKN